MNNTTKDKVKDALRQGVEHASTAAKGAGGWRKAIYITLAVLAWLASLYLASCTTSQAAQAATWAEIGHDAYHLLHPERACILALPDVDEEGK